MKSLEQVSILLRIEMNPVEELNMKLRHPYLLWCWKEEILKVRCTYLPK